MALVLTEEQELLQQTAREFVRAQAPVKYLRALRDTRDKTGFSLDLWKQMAEMGWAGILLPEEYGGSGLGYLELGVVLEECGRTLVPEPFLSTVVLGAELVSRGASGDKKEEILRGVAAGTTLLAVALQERGRFAPYEIATQAAPDGDGFVLSGRKQFVLDGHVASHIIVPARTSGATGDRDGITLFLLPSGVPGLSIERTIMVDSRNSANLKLEGVRVGVEHVLETVGAGSDLLEPVIDRATVALSAQLLGVLCEAFDRTIAYLKTRVQFDVPIGSFQALKHRAAHMFCEVELCRSVVLEALTAIDEGRDDVAKLASAAKARVSDTSSLVTCEAIQMHGGIGMTDEEEIGLFLKRARAAELTLGDGAYHRDRFATLNGF
jgi:alkylation response protein AidB-like acyl-CoA dehydrogenase